MMDGRLTKCREFSSIRRPPRPLIVDLLLISFISHPHFLHHVRRLVVTLELEVWLSEAVAWPDTGIHLPCLFSNFIFIRANI